MDIVKEKEGSSLTFFVSGRLDTTTSHRLDAEIQRSIEGVDELIFDFGDLEYISSAGLRVLLAAQKNMNNQGKMMIRNVNSEIMNIFVLTGFSNTMTVD